MVSRGIVIRFASSLAQARAKQLKLVVKVSSSWLLPWDRTLFLADPEAAPWELLPAGFEFLEQWDAAVPSWQLASELGRPSERKRTEQIALDLRQPSYEPRLLFVRDNAAGRELLSAWRAECGEDGEEHLAFLRAVHLVKPRLCVLPVTWLSKMPRLPLPMRRARLWHSTRSPDTGRALVKVELEPGRFVKCHAGDEERVLAHFNRMKGTKRGPHH